jgi:peptidyl-prolyl cis-trans isomerase C
MKTQTMVRRNLLPFSARSLLIGAVAILWSASTLAQSGSRPDPSPFAPGDLKTPLFDTRALSYGAAGQQAKAATTVVAEVDGRAVTLGDVADAIAELPPTVRNLPFDDLYPVILGQLVRQQALVIRAQRQAMDEDPAVRRKIKAVSDRVLGDELLKVETSRSITEAALLGRYNRDVAGKPGPQEARVRVIMVPSEQEAMDIIRELGTGGDFAAIAKRSSKDASAPAGGDAGFVTRDQLTSEVGAAVFATRPGQFTPFPVRSVGSWFVLKVEDRRQQAARTYSVVRDELRQAMMREAAPDVAKAALADVSVREYDITGKEIDASAAGNGNRISDGVRP